MIFTNALLVKKEKKKKFGNFRKTPFELHQTFNSFHEPVAYAVLKMQNCFHPNWSHLSFSSAQEHSIAA